MATAGKGVSQTVDGRKILTGARTLPPMESKANDDLELPPRTKAGKKKTGERFAVLNAFVDCSLPGLSRVELATWLILYRDTRKGTACTSQADIARRAGVSVRAVGKAIGKLSKSGLLIVVFRGGLNRGPSRYRVESLRNPSS